MTLEQKRGQQLLRTLNSLLRTVLIHDDMNQQSIKCAVNFVNAVSTGCAADEDELRLQIRNGRFFVGDKKLLYSNNTALLIQMLLDYFEKRQVSDFTFYSTIDAANPTDILAFARLVNQADGKEEPSAWLKEQIDKKNYFWVALLEPSQGTDTFEAEGREEDKVSDGEIRRERARKTYSYGLFNLKEVALKLGEGRRAGINKSVRFVQNLVGLLNDDEPLMLGLSTIRIYDDYTYAHSVNVALLSMCIGKWIGLSPRVLEKLGLCGLFHDLGKISIPQMIIKKPGKLTDEEQIIMRAHSLHSVRQIVMLRAQQTRKAQLVLPAFEHHMKFDHSGYPKPSHWDISLFGRIIAIADVFDAITSPRVYRKTSLSPHLAIGYMMEKAGKDFDPILLKVFINVLGVYPPGTVVELDNDEIGLVVDTPEENHASGLPRILLIMPDGNNGYIKGKTINLAEKSPDTGAYLRRIVNTVHPSVYNIQPVQYFF